MIGGGIPQYTGISTHTTTNHRVAGHLTGRHHDGREYRCGDSVVTVVFVNGGGGSGGALLLLLVLVRRLHHGGYLSSSGGGSCVASVRASYERGKCGESRSLLRFV